MGHNQKICLGSHQIECAPHPRPVTGEGWMGRKDQAVCGEGLGEVVVKTIQVHFIGLAINNKAELFVMVLEKKIP